jgi:hypothetical protein
MTDTSRSRASTTISAADGNQISLGEALEK